MRFTESAIQDNAEIAFRHIIYDIPEEGEFFDASWVTAQMNKLGHDVAESTIEYWLREKAEYGDLEFDGGYYKAI